MVKLFAAALAAVIAVSFASPPPAEAQERGMRTKKERKVARHAARPAGNNGGICLRDSGKPDDKLDFRRRCDVEEFWNRINERSSSGSPF